MDTSECETKPYLGGYKRKLTGIFVAAIVSSLYKRCLLDLYDHDCLGLLPVSNENANIVTQSWTQLFKWSKVPKKTEITFPAHLIRKYGSSPVWMKQLVLSSEHAANWQNKRLKAEFASSFKGCNCFVQELSFIMPQLRLRRKCMKRVRWHRTLRKQTTPFCFNGNLVDHFSQTHCNANVQASSMSVSKNSLV